MMKKRISIKHGIRTIIDGNKVTTIVPREQRKPAAQTCPHMGSQVDEAKCQLCGKRDTVVPIYTCRLHHTECTMDRIKLGQRQRLCSSCPDGPWLND